MASAEEGHHDYNIGDANTEIGDGDAELHVGKTVSAPY